MRPFLILCLFLAVIAAQGSVAHASGANDGQEFSNPTGGTGAGPSVSGGTGEAQDDRPDSTRSSISQPHEPAIAGNPSEI